MHRLSWAWRHRPCRSARNRVRPAAVKSSFISSKAAPVGAQFGEANGIDPTQEGAHDPFAQYGNRAQLRPVSPTRTAARRPGIRGWRFWMNHPARTWAMISAVGSNGRISVRSR